MLVPISQSDSDSMPIRKPRGLSFSEGNLLATELVEQDLINASQRELILGHFHASPESTLSLMYLCKSTQSNVELLKLINSSSSSSDDQKTSTSVIRADIASMSMTAKPSNHSTVVTDTKYSSDNASDHFDETSYKKLFLGISNQKDLPQGIEEFQYALPTNLSGLDDLYQQMPVFSDEKVCSDGISYSSPVLGASSLSLRGSVQNTPGSHLLSTSRHSDGRTKRPRGQSSSQLSGSIDLDSSQKALLSHDISGIENRRNFHTISSTDNLDNSLNNPSAMDVLIAPTESTRSNSSSFDLGTSDFLRFPDSTAPDSPVAKLESNDMNDVQLSTGASLNGSLRFPDHPRSRSFEIPPLRNWLTADNDSKSIDPANTIFFPELAASTAQVNNFASDESSWMSMKSETKVDTSPSPYFLMKSLSPPLSSTNTAPISRPQFTRSGRGIKTTSNPYFSNDVVKAETTRRPRKSKTQVSPVNPISLSVFDQVDDSSSFNLSGIVSDGINFDFSSGAAIGSTLNHGVVNPPAPPSSYDSVPPYRVAVMESRMVGDISLPVVPAAPGFVGIYSYEIRQVRLQHFWEKRNRRVWERTVKYDVRKSFADSRLRVKGRFVKKEDEALLRDFMQMF